MYMPWKFASLGLIVAAVTAAGCNTTAQSPQAPVADSEQGRCDSAAAAFVMGKKATPELVEQARAKAGARNVRLLKPNDMVTLEYRSDRLNLNADDNAVITRVNCG
jgi:Peptidase inhibitor I78 family